MVFHKLPPSETLFLESTSRIHKDSVRYVRPKTYRTVVILGSSSRSSFIDVQIWDFPGEIEIFENPRFTFDNNAIFGGIGALIWVVDAQDEYSESVARLNNTILHLQRSYPHINVEVFIHKVDELGEDYKLDVQRDVMLRVHDDLLDQGIENAPVSFHLTSIYDRSIFEAFSKVIQKLIPRLGQLEAMLTNLCRACRFERAYLFDINTKIYIATDNTTEDLAAFEICSDYVDMVLDCTDLYGSWPRTQQWRNKLEQEPWSQQLEDQVACVRAESGMVLSHAQRPFMLREVDRFLVLVVIMKDGSYDKMPQISINVDVMVEGMTQFFDIIRVTKPKETNGSPAPPATTGTAKGVATTIRQALWG